MAGRAAPPKAAKSGGFFNMLSSKVKDFTGRTAGFGLRPNTIALAAQL